MLLLETLEAYIIFVEHSFEYFIIDIHMLRRNSMLKVENTFDLYEFRKDYDNLPVYRPGC